MSTPQIFTTVDEFRAALSEASQGAGVVGFVPTLGALHSGHGSLLDAAREDADVLVASVFVNPLQFDDDADFRHYPRQLEADVGLLAAHGVDLIFAPGVEEMYPGYPQAPLVRVSAGELGRRWEGASRPGHFDGVVTVVNKLFNILLGGVLGVATSPRIEAWFGQKDAEQLAIITRMAADFDHRVRIRSLPIVRDENGLALSSRNQRLGAEDYEAALALSRALSALRDRAQAGDPLDVEGLREELVRTPGVEPDYLVVVDPQTLQELVPGAADPGRSGQGTDQRTQRSDGAASGQGSLDARGVLGGEALALIAARVDPVRLIDNMPLRSA